MKPLQRRAAINQEDCQNLYYVSEAKRLINQREKTTVESPFEGLEARKFCVSRLEDELMSKE